MTPIDVSEASTSGPASGTLDSSTAWASCLDGDRDAFQVLVSAHMDELFAAAERDSDITSPSAICATAICLRRNSLARPCSGHGETAEPVRKPSGLVHGCSGSSSAC